VTATAEERIRALQLALPKPSRPVGAYLKATRSGNLLYLSGHGPTQDGAVRYAGKVGRDISLEEGRAAARLTMLNLLGTIRAELGSLDRVTRIVKVLGFVNSAPGFVQQPKVIDGASELLIEVFGELGRHARSAVGIAELPMNIAVEIEMIVEFA
jgi:enamine deaminase RidA (YjgF/YER057c/UK114 family)